MLLPIGILMANDTFKYLKIVLYNNSIPIAMNN